MTQDYEDIFGTLSSPDNDRNSTDATTTMKLDPSIATLPGAAALKVLEPAWQEIRPPLTPDVEVDLQKSCAKLVESTKSSPSFRDAAAKTQAARARKNVQPYSVPDLASNSTSLVPPGISGRVVKGHKKTSSKVKIEKKPSSDYVPPRRPPPAKAMPPTKKSKKGKKGEDLQSDTDSWEEDIQPPIEGKGTIAEKLPEPERKLSDAGKSTEISGGEEVVEKNRKGVKKLVVNMSHAVTGYIRPHDLVSPSANSPPLRRGSSVKSNEASIATVIVATELDARISPTNAKSPQIGRAPSSGKARSGAEEIKFSSRSKYGVTYVEALPEHLLAKTSSLEDKSQQPSNEVTRSASRKMASAKPFAKSPKAEDIPAPPAVPKEVKKQNRVSKAMKSYVRPPPIDTSESYKIEEEDSSSKPEKTPKSASSKTSKKTPKAPKSAKSTKSRATEPPSTSSSDNSKEQKRIPMESIPKVKSSGSHNPLRMIHNYVKPTMTSPAPTTLQTDVAQGTSLLSPISDSEGKQLVPQKSMPTISYVPPKIRPRGRTLPTSEALLDEADASVKGSGNPTARSGPIFGGGYPPKQDLMETKESKVTSPGFFGRNPGGNGFRIHFSHFLHKQRSDGYDQL